MGTALDISGVVFGRLTAQRATTIRYKGCIVWECLCSCGNKVRADIGHLRVGDKQSCGCLKREGNNLKHGLMRKGKRHPLLGVWSNMINRCYRRTAKDYANYGGRGIKVSKVWHRFPNFVAWEKTHPRLAGTWLERKNNNGNYTARNCCWATPKQQANNRRKRRTRR